MRTIFIFCQDSPIGSNSSSLFSMSYNQNSLQVLYRKPESDPKTGKSCKQNFPVNRKKPRAGPGECSCQKCETERGSGTHLMHWWCWGWGIKRFIKLKCSLISRKTGDFTWRYRKTWQVIFHCHPLLKQERQRRGGMTTRVYYGHNKNPPRGFVLS